MKTSKPWLQISSLKRCTERGSQFLEQGILGRDGQEIDLEIKGDDHEVAEKIRGLQEGVDLKKIKIYWLEAS